jgi:hypothetical protein
LDDCQQKKEEQRIRVCRKSEMLKSLKDNSFSVSSQNDVNVAPISRRPRFDREEMMMRQRVAQIPVKQKKEEQRIFLLPSYYHDCFSVLPRCTV